MTAQRDRKRKGSPPWVRLGELLAARRTELDPAYFDRGTFARDRGINLKLAQDIENNDRENFTPLTLRDVIAPAYGIEYQSILDALAGGELAAAPGTPPHRPRTRRLLPRSPQPAPVPADDGWRPPLPDHELAAAWPHFARITEDMRLWTAQYAREHPETDPADIPEPSGADLFGEGTDDAADWDRRAGRFTPQERAWLVAAGRVRDAARERGRGTGTR